MIRIGIVGAGAIAKGHANAIRENPYCELSCVADINYERAEKMAEEYNALAFTDYKDFDCSLIDAVILNLPHYLHCEASVYFLEKGVHVLCEKPMANTVDECDRMIAAANKSGKFLAIGHVQRYYTAIEEIKEIIESKEYGALTVISDKRCKDYLKNRAPWFLDKRTAGGGIAMNLGAHSLDRILYTSGQKIEEVHSFTSNPITEDNVELNAQIILRLSGDVLASITLSGTHVPREEHETVYYFTDGVVKMIGDELFVFEDGRFVSRGGAKPLFVRQFDEFVKLIRGEKSEICTAEYGREIIRVLEKIV